ncbi:MAG: TA system VapC family ribonuclease toxin [Xanthomonadales bacterium]|nr:TA system VapC family ribonuclease toxin [Xanthomonadales bacterium]
MMLVDANLLIYAVDADSPHHERVRAWWEALLSGPDSVGLSWLVLLAFVRITTHARIMQHPMSVNEALGYVERWLSVPGVSVVDATPGMYPQLATELRASGSGGNLTNDTFLAVLAASLDATLCSADNDFRRFKQLKYFNPLLDL